MQLRWLKDKNGIDSRSKNLAILWCVAAGYNRKKNSFVCWGFDILIFSARVSAVLLPAMPQGSVVGSLIMAIF